MQSLLLIFLILITSLLSFGQIVQFDIWQDDNALIFKAQHPQEQAGVFGPGVFGLGAYRYIAAPYIFLYQLFGLNLPVFYSICIILYILAAISVFFLAIELTGNKLLSALAGLIFAAGFIGSEGVLRLFNSLQTSYSIILVCLLFVLLRRFAVKRNIFFYFLSIVFFYLTIETSLIRTQYLIIPVIVFVLLFLVNWKSTKTLVLALILNIPYLAIFYKQYLETPDPRNHLISVFFQSLFSGQIEYLFSLFGSIGNLFIPNILIGKLFRLSSVLSQDVNNQLLFLLTLLLICFTILALALVKKEKTLTKFGTVLIFVGLFLAQFIFWESELLQRHSTQILAPVLLSNFIGGSLLIIFLMLIFKLVLKKSSDGLVIFFLLSWMGSNILTYSVYLPFDPLETISRYLTHSLVPLAIFIPLIAFQHSRTLLIGISGLVIIINILLSISYQSNFIQEKTDPTKKFYKQLKAFLPEIKKSSILYFDVSSDPLAQRQFKDFFSVGSMPDSTAIAIRFGRDRDDFKITQDFDEVASSISSHSVKLDQIHSFFYQPNQLVETTQTLRTNLLDGKEVNLDIKSDSLSSIVYQGTSSTLYLNPSSRKENIGLHPVSPLILKITAKVLMKDYHVKFPIQDLTPIYQGQDLTTFFKDHDNGCSQSPAVKKEQIFKYLLAKKKFLDNVKVGVDSEEKGFGKSNLIDNNTASIWRGSRGKWHFDNSESIRLDLGEERKISQLKWRNGYANSTPTNYLVELSADGENWNKVKTVSISQKIEPQDEISENFDPTPARFIKMTIHKTYDGDSPGVSEIEIVEAGLENINTREAERLNKFSFSCIKERGEMMEALNFTKERGLGFQLSWKTDKDALGEEKNKIVYYLIPDGQFHSYEVLIPAGGTNFENLKFGPIFGPAQVEITNLSLVPVTYESINLQSGSQ